MSNRNFSYHKQYYINNRDRILAKVKEYQHRLKKHTGEVEIERAKREGTIAHNVVSRKVYFKKENKNIVLTFD
jgi:hypothetical protein